MGKLIEMQALVAVVDAGSFVRAADAMRISKAAVSRHIGELESRLGVRLLQRTTRRLSLTGEGEVFYARTNDSTGFDAKALPRIVTRTAITMNKKTVVLII